MSVQTPYRGTTVRGRDGFGRILRAEWTKLWTVPRWVLTPLLVVALTALVAVLTASGSSMERAGGAGPVRHTLDPYQDGGGFVHRPMTGDGTLVARVTAQDATRPAAKAGLMIKASARRGAPYAAVVVTPGYGVRMLTGFTEEIDGDPAGPAAPRWLKLTRAGRIFTGYQSADGTRWTKVGSVTVDDLPADAAAGVVVASPESVKVERRFGGESVMGGTTLGRATFDNVRVEPARPQAPGRWRDRDGGTVHPAPGAAPFTLAGPGDIGPELFAPDPTRDALGGSLVGAMAIVALAVLFMTSEYRRGLIHLTFAAGPRRGRVLAAKAVVIGAAGFAAGVAAAVVAVLAARTIMRGRDIITPALTEGPVLRAVLGTGLLLAVVAVLALATATILRRAAAAIVVLLVALLLPQIVASGLPVSAAVWLDRVTPAAGFAIQQTVRQYDTAIGPWAGLGVLCAYTAAAMACAMWLVRRRDA
ncbi:ABC transporter permease subunit [Actinomadura sp. SCN-SB]|uniref:ABC transporter permease subunit n=1 Tax=Actinomadura sp. SCN-SB TaxID=3373092 RepID=UPI0037513015